MLDPPGPEPDGGSSLTVDGALTNTGLIQVGTGPNAPGFTIDAPDTLTAASIDNTSGTLPLWGGPSVLAEVDVTGPASLGTAAGHLNGDVSLSGDSLLQFASGSINTIGVNSELSLTGNEAFVNDAGGGANSALSGLRLIEGGLLLHSAAVVNTGALTIDANGYVSVDGYPNDGGSELNVDGALTIQAGGNVSLGPTEGSLSAPTSITAKSIDNAGALEIDGAGYTAALTISGKAEFGAQAGELAGEVTLSNDALVTFGSGEIDTIDGQLTMLGPNAAIDDKGGSENSALKGITSIGASGELDLEDAALKTSNALTNQGYIYLDNYDGDGGSTLTVGKSIVNEGRLWIGVENGDRSATSTLTATRIDNTGGQIVLQGDGSNQALIDIKGAASLGSASGLLDGIVNLEGDGAIEFASGKLTTIDSDAALTVYGSQNFIEDSGALGSNSALKITTDNGDWNLYEGAAAAIASLTVGSTGYLLINSNGTGGASTLTISGKLDNQSTIDLSGGDSTNAVLSVAGTTTNNGAIYVSNDVETLAGAVAGTGDFYLSGATLTFDSTVSSGQTVQFDSASTLALASAASNSFSGDLDGFGTGDAIDAHAFQYASTSYNFVENSGGTGGTLTLTDGTLQDNIFLSGSYANNDFQKVMDSGTGSLIKFV